MKINNAHCGCTNYVEGGGERRRGGPAEIHTSKGVNDKGGGGGGGRKGSYLYCGIWPAAQINWIRKLSAKMWKERRGQEGKGGREARIGYMAANNLINYG